MFGKKNISDTKEGGFVPPSSPSPPPRPHEGSSNTLNARLALIEATLSNINNLLIDYEERFKRVDILLDAISIATME